MKKFILRKIFMLIYFLDRAKEQQLIRHNPCLFKTNSPYKVSDLSILLNLFQKLIDIFFSFTE